MQIIHTLLFAVTISALRISGSYLLLEEDLEFTVREIHNNRGREGERGRERERVREEEREGRRCPSTTSSSISSTRSAA